MAFDEHKCMIDSYKLLTGKETYSQMLEEREEILKRLYIFSHFKT